MRDFVAVSSKIIFFFDVVLITFLTVFENVRREFASQVFD